MPLQQFEVRVSFRKLLIALLVTVVPLCALGIYTVTRTQDSLQSTIGSHFRTVARSKASEIAQLIHDRVVAVGTLAAAPSVALSVTQANQAYEGMSDSAISDRINKIESTWNTPAVEPIVAQILSAPASRLLQRFRDVDRRFLRLTLTDAKGATIAGTHKTVDYYQADEDFWQSVYANGRGAIHLTDILNDEVTHSNYIGVGVPVMEPTTNRFLGVLDALIDVSQLLPVMNELPTDKAMRSYLVKEDGTIISGAGVSLAMKLKAAEFDAIRDAIQTIEGRQAGYLTADVHGTDTLIGFADTGLKQDYQSLAWLVLVSQDTRAALAPVSGVVRLITILVLLALAALAFVGAYFALHRPEEMTGIHEAVEEDKTMHAAAG